MEKTRVESLFNFQMIDGLTFSVDIFEIIFCQNQLLGMKNCDLMNTFVESYIISRNHSITLSNLSTT